MVSKAQHAVDDAGIEVEIGDRAIRVAPVRVGDLPAFLSAIEPAVEAIVGDDLAGALLRHADAIIEATAIGAGVEREWLDAQTPEVLAALATAVIEVNAGFFVERVLPRIHDAGEALERMMDGGKSGSSCSPGTGSAMPRS